MPDPKRALRSTMRATLATPRDWSSLSNALCSLARATLDIPANTCVMAYIATPGELNLTTYLAHLASQSISVAFPRVHWTTHHMDPVQMREFSAVQNLSLDPPNSPTKAALIQPLSTLADWQRTRHNLWQPHENLPAFPLAKIALVLTPGLAFDKSGGRLGRGGGFYDRFLTRLRDENSAAKFTGVCLDEQIVDIVPMNVEAHAQDVRMDMILTPTRLIACH